MSGPNFNNFGDVISSALGYEDTKNAAHELNNSLKIMMGQIEAVYPIGHPEVTDPELQKFVLYDVRIRHPDNTSELIPYCRMLQPGFGGGINNFLETLPTDPGASAKKKGVNSQDKRGHMCMVGFISGQKNAGIILGMMPHTNKTAVKRRPTAKGTYLEGEIQGVNFKIDNEGALTIVQNSPRKDDGSPTNAKIKTTIDIQKDGSIEITTNEKQKIRIDSQSHHIRIDNGPTYIDMDQDGDKIDVVAKNVNVGTGGLQPQIVGDDLVSWLSDLCDEITKIYVPTGVGPSGTPVNTPKFESLKAAVKEKIQSKKHKVEK